MAHHCGRRGRICARHSGKFRWQRNRSTFKGLAQLLAGLRRIGARVVAADSATRRTCFAVHVVAPVGSPARSEIGGPSMLAFARAAVAAALMLILPIPAIAADKPLKRDDLADAALKLEAQIKTEAGAVTKSAAALKREADAAFQRNDFRLGIQVLGQIITVAPDDSGSWLRLAKTVLQVRPGNERERTPLLERAAAAGYIAYQRSTGNAGEEAEALV